MIVHKNVPSNENMLQFQDYNKQTDEEQFSSDKAFKRTKSKLEVIHQPSSQLDMFRRVEFTSSFKRLPKLGDFENTNNFEISEEKCQLQIHSMKNNRHQYQADTGNFYDQQIQHCEIELIESHNQEPQEE
jgi:hypothetical protein